MLSFIGEHEYIIYEDLISLFAQNNNIKTWEFLQVILEISEKTPDSNSFLFENSSSMIKRDLSYDIDKEDSPEVQNSKLENFSDLQKSKVKVKSSGLNNNSPFRENLNNSNINSFQFKEETVRGDQNFFLNIPNKKANTNRFNKSSRTNFNLQNNSRFQDNSENINIRVLTKSRYSNVHLHQNKEDNLIKKCMLNLLKYSMEDQLDLAEQVLKFSFDSKKISIGKFYFIVLHLLKINHHYSIDVLVN